MRKVKRFHYIYAFITRTLRVRAEDKYVTTLHDRYYGRIMNNYQWFNKRKK